MQLNAYQNHPNNGLDILGALTDMYFIVSRLALFTDRWAMKLWSWQLLTGRENLVIGKLGKK